MVPRPRRAMRVLAPRRGAGRTPAPRPAAVHPLAPTHPAAIFVALTAAVCVLVSVSFRLFDPDLWQHLVFGKAIWSLRQIPHTQIFTWPNFGAPLVNPSWGFSALIWPLWSVGGIPGLFVWRWATTLSIFALLWLTARRLGARGLTTFVVLLVCSLVYRQRSQIRPETLASVWFALTLWLLETRRQGGPDRTWLLVPVAWAWANTHLSYYAAFLLVGIHLLAARGRLRQGAGPRPGRLWLTLGLMAAISFVNPYGWRALARPFEYLLFWRREGMWSVIAEMKPPDWHVNLSNGLPLLVAGWPLLALRRWRREGADLVELLMCVTFTPLGLSSIRFLATYAVAAAPYVARDLDALVRPVPRPIWSRPPWFRAALASAACVAGSWYEWKHFEGPIQIAYDMRATPQYACQFMAAHGIRGRAFNTFSFGSAMLWYFWPERGRLPFMDIHPEDSPREIRGLYYRTLATSAGWPAADARFHFDYALLSRSYTDRYSLVDLFDDSHDWALVFVDDVAALYVRRTGALAAVADSLQYRLLAGARHRLPELLRRARADPAQRAALIEELERQARASPMNFTGREMLRAASPAPRF